MAIRFLGLCLMRTSYLLPRVLETNTPSPAQIARVYAIACTFTPILTYTLARLWNAEDLVSTGDAIRVPELVQNSGREPLESHVI